MTVALFIYRNIYCRYMCPGECIIQDRGEFCNLVAKILAERFNCPIRVTSSGRPQSNGQAEAYVKNLKRKYKAFMVDASQEKLPINWDESLMHLASQALRCDPSTATGYAPAELILGRKLVYPIELNKDDVDLSGTEFTKPLVDSLRAIHDEAFGKAGEKIIQHQNRYAKAYNKRYKVNNLKLRKGSRVQVQIFSAKKSKNFRKGSMRAEWAPFRSYHKVHSVNHKKGVVTLRSKGGRVYKKQHPFSRIRLYKGKE